MVTKPKLSQEIKLMVEGVRKSSLVSSRLNKNTLKYLKENYPYMEFKHRGNILFFNSKEDKQKFSEEGLRNITIKGETIKDYKFGKLGEYLGYPSIATKWFENSMRHTKGNLRGIGKVRIYYHGLTFVCRKKDVEDCLTWLDKYRKVPEHLQTGIRKLVI